MLTDTFGSGELTKHIGCRLKTLNKLIQFEKQVRIQDSGVISPASAVFQFCRFYRRNRVFLYHI